MSYLKNFSSLIKKQNLLKCIFLTLIFQFLINISIYGMYNSNIVLYKETDKDKIKRFVEMKLGIFLFFIITVGLIILILLLILVLIIDLLFFIFSILQGIFLGLCLKFVDYNLLLSVLSSTLFLLVSMLLVGFGMVFFKQDLSWLGIILLILLD